MELLIQIMLAFLQANIMQNPQIFQKVTENRSKILIWLVALQYSNRVVIYCNKLILTYGSLENNSDNTWKLEYNAERIFNKIMWSYDLRLNVQYIEVYVDVLYTINI